MSKPTKLRVTEMARPKGRKYYPVSITLTLEQIHWLEQQPNASELIRAKIDELMIAHLSPAELKQKLQKELKQAEQEETALFDEYDDFTDKFCSDLFEGEEEDGKFVPKTRPNTEYGDVYHYVKKHNIDRSLSGKLSEYERRLQTIRDRIADLKQKLNSMNI